MLKNGEKKTQTCCPHFARQDKTSDALWMLFESHKVALSIAHIIMEPKAYMKSPHRASTLRIDRIQKQDEIHFLTTSDICDKSGHEYAAFITSIWRWQTVWVFFIECRFGEYREECLPRRSRIPRTASLHRFLQDYQSWS